LMGFRMLMEGAEIVEKPLADKAMPRRAPRA
jgi:hypothetical protein